MKRLITTLLFANVAQTALAGIYHLEFHRVSAASDPESCQTFIEDAAATFVNKSGATVLDYGCERDTYSMSGYDAIITYQAAKAVPVTSTANASVYATTFYPSRSECRDKLIQQKQLFTDATGLEPLVAFCALDVAVASKWQTQVVALGESKMNISVAATSIRGTVIDLASVLVDYEKAAAGYGVNVFESGVTPGSFGQKIVLRLFAEESYSLDDYDATTYESVDACSAAAESVRSFLAAADKPVVVFCERESRSERAILHTTAFVKSLTPKGVFVATALTSQFATMPACEIRSETVGRSSEDIFGAVCAGHGQDYRIHLFSRP